MEFPSGLDSLLGALRVKGVPVGPGELVWLQQAFNLEPAPDYQRLRDLLACTLIKNDEHREIFDDLFETWYFDNERAMEAARKTKKIPEAPKIQLQPKTSPSSPIKAGGALEASPPLQVPSKKTKPEPEGISSRRKNKWALAIAVVGIVILGAAYWSGLLSPLWIWLSDLPQSSLTVQMGLLAALGFGAWLGAFGLWCRYKKHSYFPKAVDHKKGPAWLPMLDLEAPGLELLNTEELRALVWGVERFVSEELTQQLDLKKTVAATAKAGGIPTVHYKPEIFPREVWLWRDDAVEDAAIDRLVDELAGSLSRVGLPVRRGVFADVPELVYWEEGEEFSPLVMEGHRQSALVAILTDGSGLEIADQSELDRGPLSNLLHRLSEWPKLAFVDCGEGQYGLTALLDAYRIRCISPEDLPAFLGAGEVSGMRFRYAEPRLFGDLQAWAAATALSPEPVDDRTAYELRRALGLALSPWRFRELAEATKDFHWSPERRAEPLNWLVQAETFESEKGVPANCLLGKALEFWRERYDSELRERKAQEQGSDQLPWEHTLAEQRLSMERAFLKLWHGPIIAAEEIKLLYGLFQGGDLGDEIRRRLRQLATQDYRHRAVGRKDVVFLPWNWEGQPRKLRLMLSRMHFGRGIVNLPGWRSVPGGLSMAMGLFLGIGAMALAAGGGNVGVALGGVVVLTAIPLARRMRGTESIDEMLDMVEVPGGAFLMGSPDDDDQAGSGERPQHSVSVSGFHMGRFPVTRKLYRKAMGRGRWQWWRIWKDSLLPANYVNWFDAVKFCNALSEKKRLQPCYRIQGKQVAWDRKADGYRLPTEAEWEYAVRAGTTTRWFFGDDETDLERYAWFDTNSGERVHPVGEKESNPWGFHDLIGNVWEWCWDWYGDYSAAPAKDPIGPNSGQYRALRGGSAWNEPRSLRSASRYGDGPESWDEYRGFRCVRAPRRQP